MTQSELNLTNLSLDIPGGIASIEQRKVTKKEFSFLIN